MPFLNKMIRVILIIFLLSLYVPTTVLAGSQPPQEKAITRHIPIFKGSIPRKMPTETVKVKGVNKWVWAGLGTLAAGLLIIGSGSSSSDSHSGETPAAAGGSATVRW